MYKRQAESAAREQRQNVLDRREETLVARTKRYGQAVQYALTTMPTEVGDLPSWFNMVENVWSKFEVPVDLRSKLIIPKLTSHAKSLITRLSLDDQNDYEKLRDFLLKQYQLGSREYRARFLHANKNPGETWVLYTSRLKNLFTYYTNSRDVCTFDSLFDLCVYDKLLDTLPISTLKQCLGVVKKQHMNASQLAEIADGYESNFFADGRYKGLLVTAGVMRGNHSGGRFVGNDGGGEDRSVRFQGMRGRGSNRGSPEYNVTGSSTRGRFQPAHDNRGNGSNSNSVHNNVEPATTTHSNEPISLHSSSFQRARGNAHNTPYSFNTNARPLRCWTCGEFGHRASIHEQRFRQTQQLTKSWSNTS